VYTDTNWHHWTATRDQATGQRCIYRDGLLVTNDTQAVSYTAPALSGLARAF